MPYFKSWWWLFTLCVCGELAPVFELPGVVKAHEIHISYTSQILNHDWFEVDANGDAIETAMTSSIPDYEGTVSAVKMELLDKNHFTQSFVYNGETVTQTYMRM